jgi:hypothetical protein
MVMEGEGGIKRSVRGEWEESERRVLTAARHGTMCERKPRNEARGERGRNTFQKQWHCSWLFMKRTQKLWLLWCVWGTSACADATGVAWLECLQALLLVTLVLLLQTQFYYFRTILTGTLFFFLKKGWGGSCYCREIRGAVYMCVVIPKNEPQWKQCDRHSCIGIRAFRHYNGGHSIVDAAS